MVSRRLLSSTTLWFWMMVAMMCILFQWNVSNTRKYDVYVPQILIIYTPKKKPRKIPKHKKCWKEKTNSNSQTTKKPILLIVFDAAPQSAAHWHVFFFLVSAWCLHVAFFADSRNDCDRKLPLHEKKDKSRTTKTNSFFDDRAAVVCIIVCLFIDGYGMHLDFERTQPLSRNSSTKYSKSCLMISLFALESFVSVFFVCMKPCCRPLSISAL